MPEQNDVNAETDVEPKAEARPERIKLDPVLYDTVLGSGSLQRDEDAGAPLPDE